MVSGLRPDHDHAVIDYHLDDLTRILTVQPKSALDKHDFTTLAAAVDPDIRNREAPGDGALWPGCGKSIEDKAAYGLLMSSRSAGAGLAVRPG